MPGGSDQTSGLASCHCKPVAQVEPVTPTPAVMVFACFASRILVESKYFFEWLQVFVCVSDVQRIISVAAINHCSKSNLDPVEA